MKERIIELVNLCDDEKMLSQVFTLLYLWKRNHVES